MRSNQMNAEDYVIVRLRISGVTTLSGGVLVMNDVVKQPLPASTIISSIGH